MLCSKKEQSLDQTPYIDLLGHFNTEMNTHKKSQELSKNIQSAT